MKKISLNTPLKKIKLPQRCIIHFSYYDIETLGDLVKNQRSYVCKFRNIGKSTMKIWDEFLEEHGLHFEMTESELAAYESSLNNENNADSDIQDPAECATISELCGNINWEQREWELASEILRDSLSKENLSLCNINSAVYQGEKAIRIAKAFIDKYKEEMGNN